eukprot:m.37805 g.37805  ORF g.37805 m.37805 type:complete len:221 (-) comp5466_c0_seq2:111-773(-)
MSSSPTPKRKGVHSKTLKGKGKGTDKEALDNAQENTLAWRKDLLPVPSFVQELLGLSEQDLKKKFQDILKLTEATLELRQSAILDFYFNAFWVAKENGFNELALSAFMTLLRTILENCIDKGMSLEENTAALQELLSTHTSVAEDDGMDFDAARAEFVGEYVKSGLLQHYRLFQQLSRPRPAGQPAVASLVIEQPPRPLPLSGATLVPPESPQEPSAPTS